MNKPLCLISKGIESLSPQMQVNVSWKIIQTIRNYLESDNLLKKKEYTSKVFTGLGDSSTSALGMGEIYTYQNSNQASKEGSIFVPDYYNIPHDDCVPQNSTLTNDVSGGLEGKGLISQIENSLIEDLKYLYNELGPDREKIKNQYLAMEDYLLKLANDNKVILPNVE